MYRTFNCGIGMVVCIAAEDVAKTTEILTAAGETVFNIGTITPQEGKEPLVAIN